MKKVMILLLLVTTMTTAFGQSTTFGIKGGLNYGSTGELDFFDLPNNIDISANNKVGYHLGLLLKVEFSGLFILPEIAYTKLNSEYNFETPVGTSEYQVSKIDLPILLGLNILGPFNIKAGPSFQYILENDLEGVDFLSVENPENSITLGYQLGVGLELGRLGLDLRYESAFSENSTLVDTLNGENIQVASFTIDSRPTQWILSVSYMFGDNGN